MAAKKSKTVSKSLKVQAKPRIDNTNVELVKELIAVSRETQDKLAETAHTMAMTASSIEDQNKELLNNMNNLMIRLDRIFAMFEEASKHVGDVESAENKIANLSAKLEALLEQNKNIAKGLLLLEKYVRGKSSLEQGIQPKPLE